MGLARRVAVLLLVLGISSRLAAQDLSLDPLLFVPLADSTEDAPASVDAQAVQIYRIPLRWRVRGAGEGKWGFSITFPVSFSALRVESSSSLGSLVKSVGVASIVPGLELEIPVGERLRFRPFVEVGLGRGTEGGGTEALWGSGVRARIDRPLRHLRLTFGASGMYRELAATGDQYDGHATFEGAVDAQVPLGFSVGQKRARGGGYFIARGFNGLELRRESAQPIDLRRQFEIGASFSTEPDLRIWKIRMPWIAAGYQFSEVLSGVRFYMTFPF